MKVPTELRLIPIGNAVSEKKVDAFFGLSEHLDNKSPRAGAFGSEDDMFYALEVPFGTEYVRLYFVEAEGEGEEGVCICVSDSDDAAVDAKAAVLYTLCKDGRTDDVTKAMAERNRCGVVVH